jgi:bifunctional polynucleotide phosphatase/kinase
MWRHMVEKCNGGVEPDLSASFFVGDAAGRPGDFFVKATGKPADTDKLFAEAVGIRFYTPEEFFVVDSGGGGCGGEEGKGGGGERWSGGRSSEGS